MAASAQFLDLSHHLSPEVLERKINPLKEFNQLARANPHLVSLGNGA